MKWQRSDGVINSKLILWKRRFDLIFIEPLKEKNITQNWNIVLFILPSSADVCVYRYAYVFKTIRGKLKEDILCNLYEFQLWIY